MNAEIDWDQYGREHGTTSFPAELLHKYEGKKVLDIGCGVGDHLAGLKKAKVRVGIELAFERFKQRKHENIFFVQADATKLPFKDESFDTILSVDVIEHIPDYRAFISEAYRVLRPGGTALIQTPNYPIKRLYDLFNWLSPGNWRKSLADDPTHVSKFTFPLLKRSLEKNFGNVEIFSRNILLQERVPALKKLNITLFGRVFGQKLIAVCKKPSA